MRKTSIVVSTCFKEEEHDVGGKETRTQQLPEELPRQTLPEHHFHEVLGGSGRRWSIRHARLLLSKVTWRSRIGSQRLSTCMRTTFLDQARGLCIEHACNVEEQDWLTEVEHVHKDDVLNTCARAMY